MEHLDNDMDDLFQKAGELYPLKTTGSDWDAVAGTLRDESFSDLNGAPGTNSGGSRSKRRWLLLLLLIPLGFGVAYTSGILTHRNADADKTSFAFNKTKSTLSKPIIENKPVETNVPSGSKTSYESGISSVRFGKTIHEVSGKKNKMLFTNSKTNAYSSGDQSLMKTDNPNAQKKIAAAAMFSKTGSDSKNENNRSDDTQIPGTNNTSNTSPPAGVVSNPLKSAAVYAPAVAAKENEKVTVDKKTDSMVVVKTVSTDSSLTKKKSEVNAKNSKGFYVGLLVGPDVSTVKFQSVKNIGFSIGALVGYRFNNRISIETGLLWDKKYYYSKGEYFKNSNPNYTILTATGNCNMLEIPFALKFDFASGKNHGFFAKAGLATYLMLKENYSGEAVRWMGMPYPYQFSPTSNLTNNFFSIIQLSGGYEYSIGTKTKIRAEPYVKIPLQGVGTGSMPISSFGIYFGITRSFR